jgi:radical SAM protein with 4Fe4S-binding SPASM domain
MTSFVARNRIKDFALWQKIANQRVPLDFYLEITARCNNNCSHCYINLPAGDMLASQKELSLAEISNIADQAVELGALWCLITGGEPLLRSDFMDIYLSLKRKGLLVSIFTNACLVSEEHTALFKRYPPRDIEVSVYGVSETTYERVTRKPGSYAAFRRGLDRLLDTGIKIKLKAIALRSNVHELPQIAKFCREHSNEAFRFDPLLHLRYDQDPERNVEIKGERLSPEEIVAIEMADDERSGALKNNCDSLIFLDPGHHQCNHIFHCGAGNGSFTVSYDGVFRLCADLWHPDTVYDLRKGSLADAWFNLVPRVRDLQSSNPEFLNKCRDCPIINLCLWCPAHAHLESGQMDDIVPYFCQVAHARAAALQKSLQTDI